ncbi:MAG: hypothetical protein K6G05_02970 [Lachnospiraceae bacterium]|nr:hypothetical protein [Lachnospiraceae bacterium]
MGPTIGDILYLARMSWEYTKKDICCGLCSHTAYSRYEKDERVPSKEMCDIFFQRLGFDSERIEYAISMKKYLDGKKGLDNILFNQSSVLEKAIAKYFLMEYEESRELLKKAWKYSRADEIVDVIKDKKMCLSNNELEIMLRYMMSNLSCYSESLIENYADYYYSGKSINYQKKKLLNIIKLELLKKYIAQKNYGNAFALYEKLKVCAINDFDKEMMMELFSLSWKGKEEEKELSFLMSLLMSAGRDGMIGEEGLELWQNTIKPKL